jgi:hypothetical protein
MSMPNLDFDLKRLKTIVLSIIPLIGAYRPHVWTIFVLFNHFLLTLSSPLTASGVLVSGKAYVPSA